ncbi:MAG: PD-(D/E)XK nuclease family protein [Tepidisphaeraceae bacterium]|jgi:hypothetical protein
MNDEIISRFRNFVERAGIVRVSHAESPPDLERKFLKFVQLANPLLKSGAARVVAKEPRPNLEAAFGEFIRKSLPLVIAELREHLPELAARAATARRWTIRDDLLEVAGLRFVEDAYTELMRWALAPNTHPPSAIDRQRSWLQSAGLEGDICGVAPCEPQTQIWTEDGVPDLILRFQRGTVVVETKTGSREHDTPSGKPQTASYPAAVRQTFNLPPETPVRMLFVTPEGLPALNAEAKATTFVEFAFALIRVLDNHGLSPESGTGAAYAMLFTHFFNCATAAKARARELVERVIIWSNDPMWASDSRILERRIELLAAVEMLLPERTRHE